MAMPQLTDQQIEQCLDFFRSDTASVLFQQIEAGTMADWLTCETPVGREAHWHEMQAILRLQASLRDAAAMKRLTERAQAQRAATTL